jgi:predicted nucleotidyltransferase
MLTKHQIIAKLKEKYPYLHHNYGVKSIAIFGSFAKGTQRKKSDIDLLIEFDRPIGFKFCDLSDYLEKIFKVRVDILTPCGLRSIRSKNLLKDIKGTITYVSKEK